MRDVPYLWYQPNIPPLHSQLQQPRWELPYASLQYSQAFR